MYNCTSFRNLKLSDFGPLVLVVIGTDTDACFPGIIDKLMSKCSEVEINFS